MGPLAPIFARDRPKAEHSATALGATAGHCLGALKHAEHCARECCNRSPRGVALKLRIALSCCTRQTRAFCVRALEPSVARDRPITEIITLFKSDRRGTLRESTKTEHCVRVECAKAKPCLRAPKPCFAWYRKIFGR